MHGTRMLTWHEIRQQYGREKVELRNESRWVFLNTLFSVSEAVIYMQVHTAGLHWVVPSKMYSFLWSTPSLNRAA